MRPPLPTMVLLPLGTLLQNGNYRLEQVLGHHGWQLMYEGTHLPSQQPVIIKTLNPSRKKPDKISHKRDYFLKQAQAWQQLKHPGLERVRDIFVESILPFIVTEKPAGQTWANLVQDHPLSEANAIAQISQIGSGLTLVHQYHLQHGDIRPENIVVPPETEHPILINKNLISSPVGLSSTLNNRAYAAPEQSQGEQTVGTDIYGLAATFYTLLTGQIPIAADQRQQIRFEPHQYPGLSQATMVAILRGMAMQPQHRPQSVSKWMELLPKEYLRPDSFTAESGNMGAVSPSGLEKQASPEPSASDFEKMKVPSAPSSESAVPLQEQPQTVSSTRLQSYSPPPRFPFRALIICAILSSLAGVAFGLVLRFHYQNQFTDPQVPAKKRPIKNEPFLPKAQPTDQPIETAPSTDAPVDSPVPPTPDDPAIRSRSEEGTETDPTFQDPAPLTPDPFETDGTNSGSQTLPPDSPNPNFQTPLEVYPDRLEPDASPAPFDPFSENGSMDSQPNSQ